jgi:uncharacterized protein (TIGR02231 family)
MKTRLALLIALVLAALPAFAAAATVTADSAIRAVTVYTDRAVVTRTATLDLAAGTHEIVFDKLPAALAEQSLTVSGRGTAQATILDVAARVAHVDFTPNERVKQLEDQLRALAKERRGLDDRAKLLELQRKGIDQTETALLSPAAKDVHRPSVSEITAALAFVTEQRAKITAEIAAIDELREALQLRIAAVERQLNELRGAGGRKSFKHVTVRLEAAAAGKLDLAVSYTVPGASWTPSYDVRVNSNEGSIALSYHGLVRQNTGEDWKNIALTLSTARPSAGGAVPKLDPWVIDVFVPRPAPQPPVPLPTFGSARDGRARTFGAVGVGAANSANSFQMADSVAMAMEMSATAATATVETSATSATFKISAASTIPNDNSAQKVPIVATSLSSKFEHLTTPKLVATAFLAARVENATEFPLLAGAMNVFLDGTFVATSALRTVMPGEKFDLALGADEGVAVKHARTRRFAEDTGLTGSGKRVTYEYLLTITNHKKVPVRVVVADHVPVSRHEKIVVKVTTPPETEQKPTAEGALKWTLDLKPGEKREVPLKFSVSHPGDMQVAGLEQ